MAETVVRVCAHYAREAEAALQAAGLADRVRLRAVPAVCELPPAAQAQALAAEPAADPETWVDLGGCWQSNVVGEPRLAAEHCLSLIVNGDLVNHLVAQRCYLVSPGWLAGWRARLTRWGFDQATAREFFAEITDCLMLLDTGVDPQAGGHLQAMAEYLNLRPDHLPVGLDHLRLRLEQAVADSTYQRAGQRAAVREAEATRTAADYAMALDLLGDLAQLRTEPEVVEQIRQIVEMLTAPARLRVVSWPAPAGAMLDELGRWLAEADAPWAETTDGFDLRLSYQGQILGGLTAGGLAVPARRPHYLKVISSLAPLFALGLANARTYEKLVAAQVELNEHAARLEQRVIDRSSQLMTAVADLRAEMDVRQRLADTLLETVENLETVLNASPLMIAITELATGRVLYANARFEELTGYSQTEAVGRTTLDLGLSETEDGRGALWQGGEAQPLLAGREAQFRHRSGRRWVGMVRGARIRFNGQVSLLSMVSDVTERHAANQLLRETQALLALRVSELEDRARELMALTALVGALQQAENSGAAGAVLAERLPDLFRGEAGAVWLAANAGRSGPLNGPGGRLASVAAWGPEPVAAEAAWAAACPLLTEGRPSLQARPDDHPACREHLGPAPGALCLPVAVEGQPAGLLHLRLTSEKLPVHAPLAAVLAEQLGLALSNLRLRDELRERAIHDPLTGLYNRYYMQESLERELRRAARLNHPVSLALLDLDHFKSFNDRFGHPAGDDLLRALGAYLQASVRGGDIACRYGGEEFMVILPEAPLAIAHERAELWRVEVAGLNPGEAGRSVTISVGLACWPTHGPSAEALLAAADQALYHAKAAGRDRVACAAEPSPSQPARPALSSDCAKLTR